MKWLSKHPLLILTLVCLGIFFVNLDAIFINIMEARNFLTAREMIVDGNWLLTTINGEPRYQKPPLPTWLTAFSAMIFGLKSLFGLRLPAALMGLMTVLFSFKLAEKFTGNKRYALIGSLILATSFYIIFSGRNGQWDIFTHAFMIGSIYYLFQFFTKDSKLHQNALLAGIFFAASFMSKGPVSLYALWLPFMIAFGITYKYRGMRGRLLPLLGFILVTTLLSSGWHWYVYTHDAENLAAITQREANNWTGYNIRPFYYYWSFFTQSGVWTLPAFVGLLYPYLKNRVFDNKAYRFTFWWTIASVVLLSIIPEKKSRYLLPVLIPLALNTGFYIEYLVRKFSEIKEIKEQIPVYLHFALIALIGVAFPIGGYLYLGTSLEGYWYWFVLLGISLFGIGVYIFVQLRKKKILKAFYGNVAFIVAIMCFGMPIAPALTNNPEYKSIALLNEWQAETRIKVYEFADFTPEMIWEYGKPIPIISRDGKEEFPEEDTFGMLVSEENLNRFKKQFANYHIELITRYDMNPQAPGHSTHRPRLWRDFFLLNKKKE